MLIFSTKLIVSESLTHDVFVDFIEGWLSNNRNYRFGKVVYDGAVDIFYRTRSSYREISGNYDSKAKLNAQTGRAEENSECLRDIIDKSCNRAVCVCAL